MPPTRASANELGRLLSAVAEPLYLVAPEGRIVFVNAACAQWLEVDAADMVGQQCRYSAAADVTRPASFAAALCPPPEAFSGTRVTAPLIPPGKTEQARRQAEFLPFWLGEESGCVVLVLVAPRLDAGETPPDALKATELHTRLQTFRARLALRHHVDRLIGDSPAMRQVRSQVNLAASSAVHVVVVGPPGSRAEHVGRAIHYGDSRTTTGPLVPLACPLLDTDLLDATLRTLARARSSGERPATLLLEEIDMLADGVQAELARAISSVNFAARVVVTSHTALTELADRGDFRRELAFRLSTIVVTLQRLADRITDLPLLVQWYVEQANLRSPKPLGGASPETLDRLADYAWPGDLAELEAVIGEAHARADGPLIQPHDLPERLRLASQATARPVRAEEKIVLPEYLATIERELIVRALARAKGNKTKAARLLGMTRPRFYRRLVQLGLAEKS